MVSVIKPRKNRKEHHPETEPSKNSATTYGIGPVCGRAGEVDRRESCEALSHVVHVCKPKW